MTENLTSCNLSPKNNLNLDSPLNPIKFANTIDAASICLSASSELKLKSFLMMIPRTPRTPGGNLQLSIGSPPKEKLPLVLLPISENPLLRKRKKIAEANTT
jgi:hypothetical protein